MASEGTSTSSEQDKMEATQSAVNILAQGKRNMVCGEIPTAVNQFQEACQLLSKAYGETAKECAEAYFCYGQALLDLARMENGVLGNALQGVPETDDESTEQKNEQFEKAELDDKERDKIRQDVYDAMSEKEQEKADRKKKEDEKKKESGETMEVAMDTGEGEKKSKDGDAEVKKDEKKDVKDEKDGKKDEKDDKKDEKDGKKDEKDDKKDEKDKEGEKMDDAKPAKEEKEKVADDKTEEAEKKTKKDESSEDKDSTEDGEEEGTEEEGTEEDGEGTEEEEGEGTEEEEGKGTEEGEGTEEGKKAKSKEEEGETTSQNGSQDGENPDDVSNLQLAWEMLELAKLIYKKDESKEAKLRVAEAHLKLGEVSLETEQYEDSIKDFNTCLEVQKEYLEPDNRLLAETYYQLGLGYSFNKQFKESVESYQAAIKVIETRIDNLNKNTLDKATAEEKDTKDFDHPVYKAVKEVNDLKELIPDIKSKIEDVEDEKKNMEDLKNLAKEALGSIAASEDKPSSSGEPAKDAAPASDISHLIKRKRKSEDVEEDKAKKPKQEEGAGDAPPAVNGNAKKEEKPEAMETKS